MLINECNPKITGNFPMEQGVNKAVDAKKEKPVSSGGVGSVFVNEIRKIISTTVENNRGLAGRSRGNEISLEEQRTGRQEENLKILKNTLSADVADAIGEEGKSLQDMSPEELVKAVLRIRKHNVEKQEFNEEQAIKKDEKEEEALKTALKSADPSGLSIMQTLDIMDLPMDGELAAQIMLAASMAVESQNITDSQRIFMIKEDNFSIRKLYEAGHAGDVKAPKKSVDLEKAFSEVRPQIEKILKDMGITAGDTTGGAAGKGATSKNIGSDAAGADRNEAVSSKISYEKAMGYARFLFENDLPVTEENIEKLVCLDRFKDMGVGEMLEEIVYQTSMGKMPEQADLSLTHRQAAVEVERFREDAEESFFEISAVTAKRQLEEVRIKLTVESGYRLMKQGISLDISGMQKIIDGLRQIENEYYEGILKEEGAEGDSTQVEKLRATAEAVNYLKNAPADVLGVSFSYRFSITMEGMVSTSEEIIEKSRRLTGEAIIQYETLGTAPRKDLGDSITKAFEDIPHLLDDLGIDVTEENQRAARILGRCNMEITKESVQKMKMYDSQVNHLLENLHPAIAAHMVKEGINPLEMPVYELNNKIDEMRREKGITGQENYSSYLWKLEHTEGISTQERSGYIGLYRLLHQIQSEDRAAIGNVVESGKEMTLSNLLTAVRTRKGGSFDQSVDIDFQGLSSLTYESSSITAQLNQAFSGSFDENDENSENTQYFCHMVEDILSKMEPLKISELLSKESGSEDGKKGRSFMDIPLERLYEEITERTGESGGSDGESEEQLMAYKSLMENSTEEIRFLNSLNQPLTLANLYAASLLQNGSGEFFRNLLRKNGGEDGREKLSDLAENIIESAEGEESLSDAAEQLSAAAGNEIYSEMFSGKITGSRLRELQGMKIAGDFISGLRKERHFEIPVMTEKGVTGVSLTVMPSGQEGGRVRIVMEDILVGEAWSESSDTSGTDRIMAEFSLYGGRVSGYIASTSGETAKILDGGRETIENAILENQVDIGQIQIGGWSQFDSTAVEQVRESVDTKILYQIAKSYIKAVVKLR